jgi:hypothetical protein
VPKKAERESSPNKQDKHRLTQINIEIKIAEISGKKRD